MTKRSYCTGLSYDYQVIAQASSQNLRPTIHVRSLFSPTIEGLIEQKDCPKQYRKIIEQCFDPNPERRPDCSDVLALLDNTKSKNGTKERVRKLFTNPKSRSRASQDLTDSDLSSPGGNIRSQKSRRSVKLRDEDLSAQATPSDPEKPKSRKERGKSWSFSKKKDLANKRPSEDTTSH